jgi:hypothetical protein
MSIKTFIQQEVLLPRFKKAGVMVVYDPDRRYRDLCLELADEKRVVVDATESSIDSREQALATIQALGRPEAGVEGRLVCRLRSANGRKSCFGHWTRASPFDSASSWSDSGRELATGRPAGISVSWSMQVSLIALALAR